jgi:hypothetical protein
MQRIIERIANRCHVRESNRVVAEEVASSFKDWKALDEATRLRSLRWAIKQHEANKSLYYRVMTGHF